jgi:hypothetical protein
MQKKTIHMTEHVLVNMVKPKWYYFLRDADFILYDDLLDKNMSNVPKGKKIKLPYELYAG